ncbi:proton-conducting transporter membrane subunit, partial [Staphylococcus hominis]|uniref:proton-conducting transporter transmembrane domain-containing protein n=1 Tax=Staphylococcus hominis TaxID=1290 RepID=UPI000D4061A1
TNSAQFPFYIWLPDAMEAPTPVSAYLHSATMVKAGIYLIARFTPVFAISQGWIWTVTLFGLVTLFWGSLNATKQQDLKGILAFSTVSQLGMIMSMLGIGAVSYHYTGAQNQFYVAAYSAAIFHLINHATFKGALFMITGAVD